MTKKKYSEAKHSLINIQTRNNRKVHDFTLKEEEMNLTKKGHLMSLLNSTTSSNNKKKNVV